VNEGTRCFDNGEQLVQCVPNFSEGRDLSILKRIASSILRSDVRLVDWSADTDHNRSVFTFIGSPIAVMEAAVFAAQQAVSDIDLRNHTGVHPRLGSLDVLPFVPLRNIGIEEVALLARATGELLAEKLSLPVFFYDMASDRRTTLPEVRKIAFLTEVGARGPLIAFNVNLADGSLLLAKSLATQVRSHFNGSVRALGLELPSRKLYQVSTNIIRPEEVTMLDVYEFVSARARVLESELIGAMPGYAAFAIVKQAVLLRTALPEQVLLETWPTTVNSADTG
jgi:glutamate formiminotransferase